MDLNEIKWRKSTRSGENGGDCVEVAGISDLIAIRDSKNPDGPVLAFSPEDWRGFTRSLKNR